jgi:acetyltransferase-like isoleucine patch superfamily enzyme
MKKKIVKIMSYPILALRVLRSRLTPYLYENLKCDKPFGVDSDVIFHCEGKVSFGSNCSLAAHSRIICFEGGEISVGKNSLIGFGCTISAHKSIVIGNDLLMGEFVSVRDHNHKYEHSDQPFNLQGRTIKPIVIGNNVWIAAKVTITAGVAIGNNCVIGANAVVTHSLPPNSIAAGIPARIIGTVPLDRRKD